MQGFFRRSGEMKRIALSIIIVLVAALALYVAPVALAVVSDATAPVTTADAPIGWVNETTTVTFTATDLESGVALTEYNVDGSGWQTGTQVTIAADLANHTTDGVHVIAYRSADNAGNVGATQTCSVNLDTTRPVALAPLFTPVYSAGQPRITAGGTACLFYQVQDATTGSGKANATIKIKNANGTLVKTLKYSGSLINTMQYAVFNWTMAAGTYTYTVSATDGAGNVQSKTASRSVKVYAK
jgi:hypothetical protein